MEREEVPNQQLVSLPQNTELNKFKSSFLVVWNNYIAQESTKDNGDKGQTIDPKLSLDIYFDAFKRGFPIVLQRINEGPVGISVVSGRGKRIYSTENGKVMWRLVSSSDDLFVRADFRREAIDRGLDLAGESLIYQDPFLIEEMIKVGIAEQGKTAEAYLQLRKQTAQLLDRANGALRYLPQIRGCFEEFRQEPAQISSQDLINIPGLPQRLVLLQKDVNDVIGLEQLFLKSNKVSINAVEFPGSTTVDRGTIPIQPNLREAYERTLGLILLSDSAFPVDKSQLQMTVISPEKAEKINEFFKMTRRGIPEDQWLLTSAHIAYFTLERMRPNLEKIFVELKISEDTGYEYIHHLLLRHIRLLPESYIENTEFASEERRVALVGLNASYRLTKTITREPAEEKLDLVETAEYYLKSPLGFRYAHFARLNPQMREAVLNKILERLAKKEQKFTDSLIPKLFTALKLKYSYQEKRFAPLGSSESWLKDAQKQFLGLMFGYVLSDYEAITGSLEQTITSQAITRRVRQEDILSYRHLRRLVIILNSDLGNENKPASATKDEVWIKLCYKVAQYLVLDRFADADSVKLDLDQLIHNLFKQVVNELGGYSSLWNRMINTPSDEQRLTESTRQFYQEIVDNFYQTHYSPRYPEGQKQVLLSIIKNSFDSFSFDY